MIKSFDEQKWKMYRKFASGLLFLLLVITVSCNSAGQVGGNNSTSATVVVANTIIADWIKNIVRGTDIEIIVLLKSGADLHTTELSPTKLINLNNADLAIMFGLDAEAPVVADHFTSVEAEGVNVLRLGEQMIPIPAAHTHNNNEVQGHGHDVSQGGADPHVWLDPLRVIEGVRILQKELLKIAPNLVSQIETNAQNYIQELDQLDDWIKLQIAQFPKENRVVVVDHDQLAYYKERYELAEIVAVEENLTGEGEPQPSDLRRVIEVVNSYNLKVLFSNEPQNSEILEVIREDIEHQVEIDFLQVENLSDDGQVNTYTKMMRVSTEKIINSWY